MRLFSAGLISPALVLDIDSEILMEESETWCELRVKRKVILPAESAMADPVAVGEVLVVVVVLPFSTPFTVNGFTPGCDDANWPISYA